MQIYCVSGREALNFHTSGADIGRVVSRAKRASLSRGKHAFIGVVHKVALLNLIKSNPSGLTGGEILPMHALRDGWESPARQRLGAIFVPSLF